MPEKCGRVDDFNRVGKSRNSRDSGGAAVVGIVRPTSRLHGRTVSNPCDQVRLYCDSNNPIIKIIKKNGIVYQELYWQQQNCIKHLNCEISHPCICRQHAQLVHACMTSMHHGNTHALHGINCMRCTTHHACMHGITHACMMHDASYMHACMHHIICMHEHHSCMHAWHHSCMHAWHHSCMHDASMTSHLCMRAWHSTHGNERINDEGDEDLSLLLSGIKLDRFSAFSRITLRSSGIMAERFLTWWYVTMQTVEYLFPCDRGADPGATADQTDATLASQRPVAQSNQKKGERGQGRPQRGSVGYNEWERTREGCVDQRFGLFFCPVLLMLVLLSKLFHVFNKSSLCYTFFHHHHQPNIHFLPRWTAAASQQN